MIEITGSANAAMRSSLNAADPAGLAQSGRAGYLGSGTEKKTCISFDAAPLTSVIGAAFSSANHPVHHPRTRASSDVGRSP